MKEANVVVAADADALKAAVAEHVLTSAKSAIQERGRFIMALSGGSMPQTLAGLAEYSSAIDWERVFVFFSDERCVPLDDDDSNYKACASALLEKLPIPAANVITLDPTLPSAEAMAQDYEQKMLQIFFGAGDSREKKGVVEFDLILLGMGPDGHTASLFPGHPLLGEHDKQVAALTDSPKPPPQRITLTFPVLNGAREVAFIAAGASKAPLFQEAFLPPAKQQEGRVRIRPGLPYPAFQVQPPSLVWFTDVAGVSLLPKSCY